MARRIGGRGGGSDPAGGKGGAVVAAAVVALAGAAGIGGEAALSASTATSGSTPGLQARKADSKKNARDGDADNALNRLGMRIRKKAVKQDLECLTNSFGQVREFFLHTPCTALDRWVLAVDDGAGNVAVVSVVWVSFGDRARTKRFERLIDVYGTGDVRPLGAALLDLADIRFTAAHYWSETRGNTITIAESEPATGHVEPDLLDAMTEVAAQLPRP
ncbi:hypothetical protein [Saccharothrix luteola]|uniref:hypothetical protein n=1 Tax=Saccharothrix luteola TaxID=2893018 RepID=UPI001E40588F|nr:hypothetical protein [Saccharothrix luteola]MCC8251114.1 hypothetical protein [Saccharothrix luteola]